MTNKIKDRENIFRQFLLLTVIGILVGCQSATTSVPSNRSGGFYGGDRPPAKIPENLENIPDAEVVALPLSKTGNKPYKVMGNNYRPLASAKGYKARGTASWYGKKFHGRRTSSGEPYNMFAMTAAHTVLPLPSFARVTNLDNNRSVIVKVNDRGPFLHNRIIDLSYAAATKLGIAAKGTGRVEVVALDPQDTLAQQPVSAAVSGVAGISPAPEAVDVTQYLLQIGAFASLNNAINLRQRLQQAGYKVVPGTADELVQLGSPYRVLAGPFRGQANAERARSSLEALMRQPVVLRQI